MTQQRQRRSGCLVVDDHPVVREGVRRVLDPAGDLVVVGEAGTRVEALALADRRRPDLVLVDLALDGEDAVALIAELVLRHPTTRVVGFGEEATRHLFPRVVDAGAAAILLKTLDGARLADALRLALTDAVAVAPAAVRGGASAPGISPRELEVLQLLAGGLSNRQISEQLSLSVETVKTHVRHILTKLKADRRTDAVAIALRQEIIH